MTKRYREALEQVRVTGGAPAGFRWRGSDYRVVRVMGHWREDPGWWRRPEGEPVRIEQADLWRVEARNGTPATGVYELVRQGTAWRLERVWD